MCLNCRRLKEEKAVLEAKLVRVANELLLMRRELAGVSIPPVRAIELKTKN
jgi:hypothetical protein